jgi:KTSC domain
MKIPPVILLAASFFCLGAALLMAETNEQRPGSIISRIPRHPVESSALAAVGYSSHLHALEVEFLNGAIYRYFDVPKSLYRRLIAADSKARFYDDHIRGRFRSVHVRRARTRKGKP